MILDLELASARLLFLKSEVLLKLINSFLVMNLNEQPIWESARLAWQPISSDTIAAEIEAPKLFARVNGDLSFDLRDDRRVFIHRFEAERFVEKDEVLPCHIMLTLNLNGELALNIFDEGSVH